jgi:hypothetical protein
LTNRRRRGTRSRGTWTAGTGAGEAAARVVGRFCSVWPTRDYDVNLTPAFRGGNTIPRGVLVRISSDRQDDGVVSWRSRDRNDDDGVGDDDDGGIPGDDDDARPRGGPRLIVDFAYDPDTNRAMARDFGSDPPTPAPTSSSP